MGIDKYNEIFMNLFEVDASELDEDFNFGVTDNWDSFAHMELIAELEDAFNIMFQVEDITHFGGYENGKKILLKYGVEL